MFQFPGLLGYSGLDARWAAPPDLSQPSTPDILMTPRHPPRALRSLTTPIGPPLLFTIQANLDQSTSHRPSRRACSIEARMTGPASRDAAAGLSLSCIRKGSFDTARATSRRAEPFSYCTVVEIATHPILRVTESRPGKPDPLPPHAGVCFVCDQHRIAKKHRTWARLRREGGSETRWFLVWPGGEAVKHGPAPRSAGTVDCIRSRKQSVTQGDFGIDKNSARSISGHRRMFTELRSRSKISTDARKSSAVMSRPKSSRPTHPDQVVITSFGQINRSGKSIRRRAFRYQNRYSASNRPSRITVIKCRFACS